MTKGIYSRGYLPHWDFPNSVQGITFRLADSVPHGSWKGSSAIEINRLKNRQGQLWYREFYDRFIRDENHLHDAIAYIHNNPVKAGLCATPEAWPFSSASHPNGPLASAGENL